MNLSVAEDLPNYCTGDEDSLNHKILCQGPINNDLINQLDSIKAEFTSIYNIPFDVPDCVELKSKLKQFSILMMMLKKKHLVSLYPNISNEKIRPSCLPEDLIIKDIDLSAKVDPNSNLADLLADSFLFDKYFDDFKNNQKELKKNDRSIQQNQGRLKGFFSYKENVTSYNQCAKGNCPTGFNSNYETATKLEKNLSITKKKSEQNKFFINQLQPYLYKNPEFFSFNKTSYFGYLPSEPNKSNLVAKLSGDFNSMVKAFTGDEPINIKQQTDRKLENFINNPNKDKVMQEMRDYFKLILSMPKSNNMREHLHSNLKSHYQRMVTEIDSSLKLTCTDDSQLFRNQDVFENFLSFLPSEKKSVILNSQCQCFVKHPMRKNNALKIGAGLLAGGIGVVGMAVSSPLLAAGGLVTGAVVAGVSYVDSNKSKKLFDDVKKEQATTGMANPELVTELLDNANRDKTTFAIEAAAVPAESFFLFKSLTKLFKSDKGVSALKQTNLPRETIAHLAPQLSSSHIKFISSASKTRNPVLNKLLKKISNLCKNKKCSHDEIDDIMRNSPEFYTLDGAFEGSLSNKLINKFDGKVRALSKSNNIEKPSSLEDKMAWIQLKTGYRQSRLQHNTTSPYQGLNLINLLKKSSPSKRDTILKKMESLNFDKGISDKQIDELLDLLTEAHYSVGAARKTTNGSLSLSVNMPQHTYAQRGFHKEFLSSKLKADLIAGDLHKVPTDRFKAIIKKPEIRKAINKGISKAGEVSVSSLKNTARTAGLELGKFKSLDGFIKSMPEEEALAVMDTLMNPTGTSDDFYKLIMTSPSVSDKSKLEIIERTEFDYFYETARKLTVTIAYGTLAHTVATGVSSAPSFANTKLKEREINKSIMSASKIKNLSCTQLAIEQSKTLENLRTSGTGSAEALTNQLMRLESQLQNKPFQCSIE